MSNYSEVALMRTMAYLQDAQSTIAHNLANVDTSGFKRRAPVAERSAKDFQTLLQEKLPTVTFREYADWQQGTSRQTGGHFDVAIDGPYFFRVQDNKNQVLYTRQGAMRIDDKGRLVTRDGLRYLDANNQEISLQGENGPASDVTISPRGTVSDPIDGRTFGTLGVWKLGDLNALQSVGAGRYLDPKKQTAQAAPGAPVQQGAVEGSNVDSLQEMVRMITVQRSFTAAQKALSSASRMQDSLANEILR